MTWIAVRDGCEAMALAVNRSGTIVKKCDRSNHKPAPTALRVFGLPAYVRQPEPLRARVDAALLGQRQAGGAVVPGQEAPGDRQDWSVEQLPVTLGDDSDLAVDDGDGGLVVDGVARHVERGGPALRVG
jgi:hypothetical protein